MRTDTEFESLLHVILTNDVDWGPCAIDFDVEDNKDWYDAISDNVDHSVLFDEFGNYKERTPDLEISCADTYYYDTLTPDQHASHEMVEATFVCAEHVYHVHHFHNDDFKTALFVNDTEIIDAPNLIEDDDDDIVPYVVPPDKLVEAAMPLTSSKTMILMLCLQIRMSMMISKRHRHTHSWSTILNTKSYIHCLDGKMPRLSRKLSRILLSTPGCLMVINDECIDPILIVKVIQHDRFVA